MKKLLSVIAICALAMLSLCSCGGPTPTETADTFLTAVKAQDTETINSVYAGEELDLIDALLENGNNDKETSDDEESEDLLENEDNWEIFTEKLLSFDYELSDEKIDGDDATVKVKFTTYNIGSAFTEFMSDYMGQALTLAFSNASDEQVDKIATNILNEKLTALGEKSYTETTKIKLVKVDGEWKVANISDKSDFLNALSGNLVETIKNLEDAYSFDEE